MYTERNNYKKASTENDRISYDKGVCKLDC